MYSGTLIKFVKAEGGLNAIEMHTEFYFVDYYQ